MRPRSPSSRPLLGRSILLLLLAGCASAPPPPVSLPPAPPPPAGNPLAGMRLYVDHTSQAATQARVAGGTQGQLLMRIAQQPQADWFGEWTPGIESAVRDRVSQAAAAGGARVMVAYNVPNRDCGQYSRGGATDPAKYRKWITGFARGIGERQAVVILEPDALGQLTMCLSEADQQVRLDLLRYAVRSFRALPHTAVYLDGGNANWLGAEAMAARLDAAGLREAHGFALNVSNYIANDRTITYGKQIAASLGAPIPFVIDTSRNGQGEAQSAEWCNPGGRGLGRAPTVSTGDPQVHAFLWIKRPGESDGTCNGGPPAGQWFMDAAIELVLKANL